MTGPVLPEWILRVDRPLARAAQDVRLLGAATPCDAASMRKQLVQVVRGNVAEPTTLWTYPSVDASAVRGLLEEVGLTLERVDPDPLRDTYLARVRELDLEAELSEVVGSPTFGPRALARFGSRDPEAAKAATALARAWITERGEPVSPRGRWRSDGLEPESLLSRMRAEVGRRRLPFSVRAHAELAPLAATGERVILVASGRDITGDDVERTVLHEIEGHATPQARAATMPLGIFGFGTARGSDDQEGRALVLERRAGFLTAARKRQLAARHLAVEAMTEGATLVETARMLVVTHGLSAENAVLAAERAFRGGDGRGAGLGRERVYLESFVRVRAHFESRPADERVMESGAVAVEAIAVLAAYVA